MQNIFVQAKNLKSKGFQSFIIYIPKYLVAKLILTYVARFWRNNHPREIIDIFAGMGKISPSNEEWNIVKENNFLLLLQVWFPTYVAGPWSFTRSTTPQLHPPPPLSFLFPRYFSIITTWFHRIYRFQKITACNATMLILELYIKREFEEKINFY